MRQVLHSGLAFIGPGPKPNRACSRRPDKFGLEHGSFSMKKYLLPAVLAALLLSTAANRNVFVAQTGGAQQPAPTTEVARSAQVDSLFAPLNEGATPGAAVLVVQNGKTVFLKTYGLARLNPKEPVTADTAFDLASVSKQFTARAIMILADRDKLSFDDPITKFFPQFPAYAQKITIRNLLTHTSGLVDVINPKWFKAGYEPTSKDLLKMMVAEPAPSFIPGEKFEYNNAAYVLLALIVEKASGEPFARFMKENVFKPLGMNSTVVLDE